MIAIDTHLLLRLVLVDDPVQQARVNALFKTGKLITAPATVMLELVWVLESRGFSAANIVHGLTALLDIPNFKPEHDLAIREALHGYQSGMDFADALHLALSAPHEKFMTFDRDFMRKAKKLGLPPAANLQKRDGVAARALEFTLLTAARSGETRGATWAEIDLEKALWTVPANRMKAGIEHSVPLSDFAIKILNALPRLEGCEILFPAPRKGKLSDMALTQVMRRMELEAVPHGLRSTFRDWAGEKTNFPRDLCEAALAHALTDTVEAAYRRGTMIEKRRNMMQAWAKFLTTPQSQSGKVTILTRHAA